MNKKVLRLSVLFIFVVFICTACNGTITRNIRHAGFNVGGSFECSNFYPKDKEDTSYDRIRYFTDSRLIDEDGIIYEISLGQKFVNNQNCKKANTDIVVKAIMDNHIIKGTDDKYYYLVGQSDVSSYSEVLETDNSYEIYDLLLKQNDVVKVMTANSSIGQYFVLKNDGNVLSYIISKEERDSPAKVTSIKKVYDKNDYDSAIVDFNYAGESINTFIKTEKSVYRLMITNSDKCKKYADIPCRFKMKKDPIFDEYRENIIMFNGSSLLTNYKQMFTITG